MARNYRLRNYIAGSTKLTKRSPVNPESLSPTMMSGVPNDDNQFKVTLPRIISAACASFFPVIAITEKREKYLECAGKLQNLHNPQNPFPPVR